MGIGTEAHLVNWFRPNLTKFVQLLQNGGCVPIYIRCLWKLDQALNKRVDGAWEEAARPKICFATIVLPGVWARLWDVLGIGSNRILKKSCYYHPL